MRPRNNPSQNRAAGKLIIFTVILHFPSVRHYAAALLISDFPIQLQAMRPDYPESAYPDHRVERRYRSCSVTLPPDAIAIQSPALQKLYGARFRLSSELSLVIAVLSLYRYRTDREVDVVTFGEGKWTCLISSN